MSEDTQYRALVGHICNVDSFLAVNKPYAVEVFPISEDGKTVLIGIVVEDELDFETLQHVIANKDFNMPDFEVGYKNSVISSVKEKEFSTLEDYNQWIDEFQKAPFDMHTEKYEDDY